MRKLIPHPIFALFLALIWCFLKESFTPVTFFLGYVLSLFIIWFTQGFWHYHTRFKKWPLTLMLAFVFFYEVIVANLQVLKLVFTPRLKLRPVFLELPLDLKNDLSITILAFMITLTPGTLSVDVSEDRKYILVHCINTKEPQKVSDRIKRRFEKPLLEILQCSPSS